MTNEMTPDQAVVPPEVWWSPTVGVIELVDFAGPDGVYRIMASDGVVDRCVGMPARDAIELVPAMPPEEWERIDAASARLAAVRPVLDAVRKLHWRGDAGYCVDCCAEWPCPTDLALSSSAEAGPGDVADLGPECDHEPRVGGACHGCAADHYRRRADQLANALAAVRSALAELVSLKDGPRDDRYRARKDWAWANARAALGSAEAGAPTQPDAAQRLFGEPSPSERSAPVCDCTLSDCAGCGPDAGTPAAEPAPDERCYVAEAVDRLQAAADACPIVAVRDAFQLAATEFQYSRGAVFGSQYYASARALAGAGAPEPAQDDERPDTCPTCHSSQPHLHPSPELCPDPWHKPVPTTVDGWRREVARWADLLRNLAGLSDLVADPGPAAERIADDMTRALAAGAPQPPTTKET